MRVVGVRWERRAPGDRLGIGTATPCLSWRTETDVAGWRQVAYEIKLSNGWTSGRVESEQSTRLPWAGEPLQSRERVMAIVQTWGSDGSVAEPGGASVEVGLLDASDWTARFISSTHETAGEGAPALQLRGELEVSEELLADMRWARLYVSALGVYEIHCNFQRVGDHVLAPGWTSYDHRLRYEVHDVGSLLQPGTNTLDAVVGEGWYAGRIGFGGGSRNIWGDRLALLAQLEVTTKDGTVHTVGATDPTWRSTTGPIRANGIYDGETYDGRLVPGEDDPWGEVEIVERDLSTLVAREGPPVRRTQEIEPVSVTTSPSGATLVDFGQNLVGRVCLRVPQDAPAGSEIQLRHAEVLVEGELADHLMVNAACTDHYITGGYAEAWEPRLTFHGFRHVQVDGWPGTLTTSDLRAFVLHSDMERTGWFSCSDERLNQLHDNIVWGMRGNFLDVPTDCPQRGERLGWTGDIQVFAPTASFLYDCAGFLASWLRDVAADQTDAGVVPNVVPTVPVLPPFPAAAWGDAAVIVPWVLYERFGDADVLAEQYDSMRGWVEHLIGLAGDNRLWDTGFQFGDWLDPAAPPREPNKGRTDYHLVASAYMYRSIDLLRRSAEVLGRDDDAERYRAIGDEVRTAFHQEYVAPSGRISSDAQTAYVLALRFGLLTDEQQCERAVRRLAQLVRGNGFHIGTGFVGTPLICDALVDGGEIDTAYKLLLEDTCPSWLYPVTQGATTIWERWDGIRPDGSIYPDHMNSFNHYAFGAVGDFLHRRVAGLAPGAPGYQRLEIAPVPGGGLTEASARHRTPYGEASVSWTVDGGSFTLDAIVPPGTRATVSLPDGSARVEVASGQHTWTCPLP